MSTKQTSPAGSGGLRVASLTLALVALGALTLSGCGAKKEKASQTAARVNKEDITVHQINYVLQQQRGLKQDQAEEAGKQVLERLIDQELAVQKAQDIKLDRDPRVVQQIEATKREILARAYADKISETATKPSAEDVQKYYDAKPALFKERKVYSIQELSIEAKPEQLEGLRAKLTAAKGVNEFIEYLKANDFKFAGNQAVRAAEQLPLAAVDTFAKMTEGQAILNASASGAQVVVVAGVRSQPVTLEQAKPAIEQFLLNDRKRELITKDMKDMRTVAKIEYVGKFQAGASSASASAPAGAASGAEPAARAASGLDANAINKGLGIK